MLVIFKIIGIVWPPIPGGILTVASIPIIGWHFAFLADLTGTLIGGTAAYFLGKKYGRKILEALFDENLIKHIDRIKIHEGKEVEGLVILRVFIHSISEIVSYGAGLLGIEYKKFILSTFLAMLVFVPFFYFFEQILEGRNIILNMILTLSSGAVFVYYKDRYFVLEDLE